MMMIIEAMDIILCFLPDVYQAADKGDKLPIVDQVVFGVYLQQQFGCDLLLAVFPAALSKSLVIDSGGRFAASSDIKSA